ncbi:ferritin light chain-like [Hetaerina americana]|uniref:ferritin light chain-like n=1 Tax=Hetaerina americana TaxID=62018 RepID=UPI003A7F1FF3
MNYFIILSCILAAAHAKSCYDESVSYCAHKSTELKECGARYGHVNHVRHQLQNYLTLHLNSSFEYLLMSTNLGGYVRNREGMEKVLRHLSDSTWNDAIELIKYMSKRGVDVIVDVGDARKVNAPETFSFSEIKTLAYALDSQKLIASEAMEIHKKSIDKATMYDPEVASFLENQFLHKHSNVIREMAGLVIDLRKLIDQPNTDRVSYFIFDEYLKKM